MCLILAILSLMTGLASAAGLDSIEHFTVRAFEGNRPLLRGGEFARHCVLDAETLTGRRLRCGSENPYFEILTTRGDNDAALVLHYRKDGHKDRKTFLCSKAEQDLKCRYIPPRQVSEKELLSPMERSHPVLTMRNSHSVGPDSYHAPSTVMRGMAPRSEEDFASLKKAGVKQVLMFKDEVAGDTTRERETLLAKGWDEKKIHHIPFPWKNYANFEEPCRQAIDALRIIKAAREANEPIYFHCTVGEDRTGFLAGMYRMLSENKPYREVFLEEMCERGYSWGDAGKPFDPVVTSIEEATTNLFLKLSYLVKQGKLSWENLSFEVCKFDPQDDEGFQKDDGYRVKNFWCKSSTRYRPIPAE